MHRRTLFRAALLAASLCLCGSARAQNGFPEKPIRLIVPYAAGGNTDVLARMYGQKLGEVLKTAIIVENKTGSGAVIGTDAVAKAPSDGHTLLFGTSAHTINATLYPKLPYDSRQDFAPITLVAEVPMVLSVHPKVPARTAQELVALLRANPGKYSYASSGNGGSLHMAAELLQYQEKLKALRVPYRGAAPALTDTVAGQVDFIIDPITTSAPFIKAGKLRALAVTTAARAAVLPDVPTMEQAGYPAHQTSTWNLVMAPAGTPAPIIYRLNDAFLALYTDPVFRKQLSDIGVVPLHMTPTDTAAYVERETAQWARVIGSANLRPE